MPYQISSATGGGYKVTSPNGVRAKNTTKTKAQAQVRLLNATEFGEMKPTKKQK